jgi:hypothetical protein
MSEVNLSYGSYQFTPVPLMNISKSIDSTADGTILGETLNITLDGSLVCVGGPTGIAEIRDKQNDLMSAFSRNGQLLLLTCGTPANVLMSGYPVVNSLELPEDIWVQESKFTIGLTMGEITAGSGSGFITDATDEWNLELDDSSYWQWTLPGATGDSNTHRVRLTHSVSATGRPRYQTTGKIGAITNAKNFVLPRLGYDSSKVGQSGVINMNVNNFAASAYDHIRSVSENELAGSYSVTESWLVQNTGIATNPGTALEDFTINLRQSTDSPFIGVSIEGQIQGVETKSYGTNPGDFSITTTKYTSASGTWNNVKNRLLGRANLLLDSVTTASDINPTPLSTQIGHNPNTGNISYAYEYNTRPTTCITGAITETITIVDNYATDIFAVLTIPGRAVGQLPQDLSTTTLPSRQISIEAVMAAPTGCPTSAGSVTNYLGQAPKAQVQTILNAFQAELESSYSQVFVTENNITWVPTEARISATLGLTYQSCS